MSSDVEKHGLLKIWEEKVLRKIYAPIRSNDKSNEKWRIIKTEHRNNAKLFK